MEYGFGTPEQAEERHGFPFDEILLVEGTTSYTPCSTSYTTREGGQESEVTSPVFIWGW